MAEADPRTSQNSGKGDNSFKGTGDGTYYELEGAAGDEKYGRPAEPGQSQPKKEP